MAGRLVKALSVRGDAVLVAVDLTPLVQEQMRRLNATPSAMIHLGQALMAASLLQALGDPDDDDRVQCEWTLKGDMGNLYAEAFGVDRLRGTVGNPQLPAEEYGKPFGTGVMQVRRHHAETTSTGMVTSTGGVGADLVEYLERSDQRLCGSNLSVKIEWDEAGAAAGEPFRVRGAHGYLLHVLPQATEAKQNEALRWWDAQMNVLGPVSHWKLSESPQEATLEMVRMLSMEEHPRVVVASDCRLHCTCNEERVARAVALLKAHDAESLPDSFESAAGVAPGLKTPLAHDRTPEVRCEFCGRTYQIHDA